MKLEGPRQTGNGNQEGSLNRWRRKSQQTLGLWLENASQWLPKLKDPKDFWRQIIAGILALQVTAFKPNQGIEDQSRLPPAIIKNPQTPSDNPPFRLPDATPDSPEAPQQQEQTSTIIEQSLEYYLQGLWENLNDEEKQRLSADKLGTEWVLVGENIFPNHFFVINGGNIITLGVGILTNPQDQIDGIVTFTLPNITDPNQKPEAHLGFANYDKDTNTLNFTNGQGEIIAQIPNYLDENREPNLGASLQTPEGKKITTLPAVQPTVIAKAEIIFNGSKNPQILVIETKTNNPNLEGSNPVLSFFEGVGLPTEFAESSSSPSSLSPEIISQLQSQFSPEELSQVRIEQGKGNGISIAVIDRTIQNKQVKVKANSLNVREGSGTNFNIISSVTLGQTLTVLSEADGWYQVQLPDGRTGWVSGEYVIPLEQPTIITEEVAFYFNGQWLTEKQFMEKLSEESLIYVDGLIIDDPRATNPDLFDLQKPDSPISRFVKAMRMGGIEVDPKEVLDNLQYQVITGVNGEQYVVGFYYLDPDPNQRGETLEGPICLMIARENENDEYKWSPYTHGELASAAGILMGVSDTIVGNLSSPTLREFNQIALADALWRIPYSERNSLFPREGIINPQPLINAVNNVERRYPDSNIMVSHLVWGYYAALPNWLINGNYSKQQIEQFITDYIVEIMTPLRGRVDSWIVVNEPFSPPWNISETGFFSRMLGPDYSWIINAFETAHNVDPDATLLFNDYRIEIPGERLYDQSNANRIFEIVNEIRNRGIPVEVGFQMHLYGSQLSNPQTLNQLSENFRRNIRRYNEIGVRVNITEWDIRMGDVSGTNEERAMGQANMYYTLMRVALEEGIKNINFFGLDDEHSWLEEPNVGGPNASNNDPTLKWNSFLRKPAWYAINQALLEYLLESSR